MESALSKGVHIKRYIQRRQKKKKIVQIEEKDFFFKNMDLDISPMVPFQTQTRLLLYIAETKYISSDYKNCIDENFQLRLL